MELGGVCILVLWLVGGGGGKNVHWGGVVLLEWFSNVEDVYVMGCGICTRGGYLKPSPNIVGCNAKVGEHVSLYSVNRGER